MNKKRVLFITFYWPPSGKASLHWPLSIIRHLPSFGWEPIVLTVEEDSFTGKDESLLKLIHPELNVVKTKFFDVFKFYKRFIGKGSNESLSVSEVMSKDQKGLRKKISLWIRMNLFVPDARIGWYGYGVSGGKRLVDNLRKRGEDLDAIISIGTPHSAHLIGKRLSNLYNIPHIPLFTDPWVSISYYKEFKRNILAEKLDNHFEKSVLKHAATVIFVSKYAGKEYIEKYPFLKEKVNVLYWGYNEDAFSEMGEKESPESRDEEILLHSGNIFDYQNPKNLWKTLRKRIDSGNNLRIKFTGTVGPAILKSIKESGLENHFEILGFLPYQDLIKEMGRADYLLLCSYDERHVPGKLFEYLRSGKPILGFCDKNDEIAEILIRTNSGKLMPYQSDAEDFFDNIEEYWTDLELVSLYERENISKELSEILNKFL